MKVRVLPAHSDSDDYASDTNTGLSAHSGGGERSTPAPRIRSEGEFQEWVRSWIALSRLYNYHDIHERPKRAIGAKRQSQRSLWRQLTTRRRTPRYRLKLGDMPPEVLQQIASYLGNRDLATLLQTPSTYISAIAHTAIASRRHSITCLANLHTFLAYGGRLPIFYRTATMFLFGRHFIRLVPEAKNLLGVWYAVILAWFLILFYTFPFLLVIAIYIVLDVLTLMVRTTASLMHHTSPITTTSHFPAFFKTPTTITYTQLVRDLSFTGATDPHTPTRGLLNPWASHLYLLTNCCPNLRRLHLVGCSLAWWFRLAPLSNLEELVLEACELDETGLEILAENCGSELRRISFVGGEVRGGDIPDDVIANNGNGMLGIQVSAGVNGLANKRSEPVICFPKLEKLSFSRHAVIDAGGLDLFMKRAPTLTNLTYSTDCRGLHTHLSEKWGAEIGQDEHLVGDVQGLSIALASPA